jgi:predicted SAM-dependent methyltransferase
MQELASLELLEGVPPIARGWLEERGLRGLDSGCGKHPTPGWFNVDMRPFAGPEGERTVPGRVALLNGVTHFLQHDLREPLPIEDESFDWVYSSHLIEHVHLEKAIEMLREVRRLLKPGGHLRLSTPDLRRYVEGYRDPEHAFFERHRNALSALPIFAQGVPDRPGWMVNQIFQLWGHEWIYDVGEVRHVAAEAGFDPAAVVEVAFRQGREPAVAALDPEGRDDESLYVEIVRT